MKLIIAGTRTLKVAGHEIADIIESLDLAPTEVVSGLCRGPDSAGLFYAISNDLKTKRFPANWAKHGKKAGIIRNMEMAKYADVLLLIWDGKSKGSKHMLATMKQLGKPVHEILYIDYEEAKEKL